MTMEMPCPPPGKTIFEAQALHSDNQWDAMIYRLPIRARQYFWQTRLFQWLTGAGLLAAVAAMVLVWARRRTARQMALMQAQTALAEERARIARDLHDDLGANSGALAFTWPQEASYFSLYTATNLAPPVVWTPLTNAPVLLSNEWRVTLLAATNSQRFFRLHAP
jgi:hypothetical protein